MVYTSSAIEIEHQQFFAVINRVGEYSGRAVFYFDKKAYRGGQGLPPPDLEFEYGFKTLSEIATGRFTTSRDKLNRVRRNNYRVRSKIIPTTGDDFPKNLARYFLFIYPKSFQVRVTNGKGISTLEDFLAEMKSYGVTAQRGLYRAPTDAKNRRAFGYFYTSMGKLHKSVKSILRMPASDSRLKDRLSDMINTSKELKIILDNIVCLNSGLVCCACSKTYAYDYLDIAFHKLLYVIPRYNPFIGRFSTFAVDAMKREIKYEMRKDKRRNSVTEELSPEALYDRTMQKPHIEDLDGEVMGEILKKLVCGNGRDPLLSPVETEIINSRYGFNGNRCMTLEAVGEKIGVTKERVRQVQSRILRKLKEHLFMEFDRLTQREI